MGLRKFNCLLFVLLIALSFIYPKNECLAKNNDGAPAFTASRDGYPTKFTNEYLNIIKKEYKKVTKDENVAVALDMMKDTTADFSRSAILGYNLTEKPIKISFKDLSTINEQYASFDALGWKKGSRLYIYINNCHSDAPPAAIAALLSHEALHQDEYNSLAEETYAWTMEAAVWCEMCELYPKETKVSHPLATRENTLKTLFIKGRYSDKYIKKSVHSNTGYQNLPQTSPGFEKL